jgi:hypothetical protein
MNVLILYAHRNLGEWPDHSTHRFSEVFTTEERLNAFLAAHPDVTKDEVCLFEVDPK